jgi:site-specific recombinase XerC
MDFCRKYDHDPNALKGSITFKCFILPPSQQMEDCPRRTIQELLGHSDVRTTMIFPSKTIKEAQSTLDMV